MKVISVNGSPHKEGCTYTALCEVADTLQQEGIETETFWIGNKPIGGCIACKACTKSGCCATEAGNTIFYKFCPINQERRRSE